MIAALTTLKRNGRRRAATAVRIRVHGGYEPAIVHARVGEPLQLVFRREETAACSERVVFPAFGKSAMLPPYQDVVVELAPTTPGTFEFTCQLGVLRGTIVVEDGGEAR